MLIRISLIVAILAGLGVGTLNFVKVKEKITTLISERDDWHGKFDKTDADLRSTKKTLDQTRNELTQTKQSLDTAKEERAKAVEEAATAVRRATQLTEELGKTRTELGDAQAELSKYRLSGLSPEQVLTLNKTLKDTQAALAGSQEENTLLGLKINKLSNELALYRDSKFIVYLPSELHGKVVSADPRWDFVILDIGENQGVLKDGELLVSRNGDLVAKVRIQSVEKDRCVANIIPGPWKLGDVLEGDQVIPAHPGS